MPPRASYRDLLRDLLGRPVTIRPGPDQELDPAHPAYLAGYRYDDGVAAAVVVVDEPLSVGAAAALGMEPLAEAVAQAADSGLEGDLLEFLHEVVNVAAKLFNSPGTPHVVLRELLPVPGDVPEDLAGMATEPRRREDWTVSLDGYGEGRLTLLA